MEKVEPLLSAVGRENGRATGKPFGGFSNNEMQSPHDPGVSLLSTRPRGPKTSAHTNTCTQTVIAALFARAKKWKQHKLDKWIYKTWHWHAMEEYSALKRNSDTCHNLAETCRLIYLQTSLVFKLQNDLVVFFFLIEEKSA